MESRNEPIYRPIVREALAFAWRAKILWIVALFAGMCMTGSVFDVIWRSMNSLTMQASILGFFVPFWQKSITVWSSLSISGLIVGSLQVLLATAFILLLVFTVFSLSVIAQGMMIHAIGSNRKIDKKQFLDSMRVGARSIWPILVLNLISIAILLACRGLIAIAFAFSLQASSVLSFIVYFISFIAFTLFGLATFIVQIFAMNSMILQGATLAQSIERGIEMLKRHWITATEVTSLLFLISVGLFALAITGALLVSIPFVICLTIATLVGSNFLFSFVTILFILIYATLLAGTFGYAVLFHYAVWTSLFRAFGEGGILPKIHRITRSFIHQTKIPGSR